MNASLPEPLTPPECDLKDFPFTPIYRARLFGSVFHAKASDGEWRAGVTLWLKSQDQVPAGSLPDDDVDLCRLAELGRDLKTWRKLRSGALHGWNRHSDGRLYHKVVAIEALVGWIEKLLQRKSSAAGNAKRWGAEFDTATLDASLKDAIRRLAALDPQSRTLQKRGVKLAFGIPDDDENVTLGIPVGSKTGPGGIAEPQENRPKGQGQGREDSELPRPESQSKEEIENLLFDGTRDGKKYREGTVTIANPHDRLARFKAKLASQLGPRGFEIVASATDRADPDHDRNLSLCREVAKKLKKGWPRLWFDATPAVLELMPKGARSAHIAQAKMSGPKADLVGTLQRRLEGAG